MLGTVLLKRYEVIEQIGTGRFSVVYKARQLLMNRLVAIKSLKRDLLDEKEVVQRFKKEARALSRLRHPNIVAVFDCFESQNGRPYLVMDYLDGMSLEDLLAKDHFLNPDLAKPILLQVCDALAHAHRQGVLHRDLKPGNMVLLAETKGSELVQLVDFGLAQVEEEVQKLTQDGECCGSPAYMSPEHCTGEPLDGRSDIYSFGVVMYETLTGVVPFKGRTSVETMRLQVYENPPSFSQVRPDLFLPADVEETVLRCLAKEPEKRFQTATQVKEAIQNWGKNVPSAGAPLDSRQLPAIKTPSSGELDAIGAGHDSSQFSSAPKTKEWATNAPPKKETPREPRPTIEQPKSNKLKRWTDTQQKANDLRVPILVACMVMVVLVAVAGTAYFFQQEWHPSTNKVEASAPPSGAAVNAEAGLPHDTPALVSPTPSGNGGDHHGSADISAPAGTTDRPMDEEIPPSTVSITSASTEAPAPTTSAVSTVQPADNATIEDENGLRLPADQSEQPTHAAVAPPPAPAAAKQSALSLAPPVPVAPQPKPVPAVKPIDQTKPASKPIPATKPAPATKPSINPGVVDFFAHPNQKPATSPAKPATKPVPVKPTPAKPAVKPPVNAVKPAQVPPVDAVKPAAPAHPAAVTPPAPAKPHPKPAPKPHKPPKKKAAAKPAVAAPPKPAPEPPPPTVPTHRRAYQTY